MSKLSHPLGIHRPAHPKGIHKPTNPLAGTKNPPVPAAKLKAPPQLPVALGPAPQDSQNPGVFKA